MSEVEVMDDQGSSEVRFVRAWLRLGDPFKAAIEVFPNDNGRACRITFEWPQEPRIIALRERLLAEEGEKSFMPSRAELARELWNIGTDRSIAADDRTDALYKYANVMGFVEKPGVTINNNTLMDNRTMIVKDHGSDDEWERKLLHQQERIAQQH